MFAFTQNANLEKEKVSLQLVDFLVEQVQLEFLTSRVESSHESKTLNFKVLFIKLEYN